LTQSGAKKPKSYPNTSLALSQLGLKFGHDIFHNKKIVEGDVAENLGPQLSDASCRAMRDMIIRRFGFDPGIENVQQAAERACEMHRYDPVLDYLDSLRWDGKPRLDRWLTTHLGAEDTPLNQAIGRKMLIAAVRRGRHPGCKFDYVVVLEGKQGTGKSSALRTLAGDENFSDQPLLHLDSRAQQEALEGVWLYEISELVGLRRTEIETVKGFISRTSDNVRPAYGRFRVDQLRRSICVGTTNDNQYLRDATGNRRFWPVKTGKIDLIELRFDRDQLWAEAAAAEAQGEPLLIQEYLYKAAADQQEQRLLHYPWEDALANVKGTRITVDGTRLEERISSKELLSIHLKLSADKQTDAASKRLRNVMNRLGWQGPKKMKFDTTLGFEAARSGWQEPKLVKSDAAALQGYWRLVPKEPG
jgi:predicted P-loop ATPase